MSPVSCTNLDIGGLNVNIIGEGEAIIFLHGGPGSEHRFFLPHVLPLSQKFKLILYDQKGCGKSKPSFNNQYSMDDELRSLEILRKELKIDKINIFGESWGSMLALLYATTYPERVNKIFLTAAIGIHSEAFKAFESELEKRLSEEDKEKLAKVEMDFKKGKSPINKIFKILDKYYVYSERTLKKKQKIAINTDVNTAIGRDILDHYDLTHKLDVINNIPIIVAQGSHDIFTPNLVKKYLLDYLPHAKLTIINH